MIYNMLWVWKIDFFTIFGGENPEKKGGQTMEIKKL